MEGEKSEVPVGSSLVMNKSSTTRTAVASALMLVLVASILTTAAAFVHSNNSRRRRICSNRHRHRNPNFVPTSKIKDLSVTPSVAIASPIRPPFRTMLFCEDDDDGDMDMDDDGDMDDYDDDDYDDEELIIDVEGDEDYDDVDDDVLEDDPYMELAPSEFGNESSSSSSALTTTATNNAGTESSSALTTDLDWGGALGALRSRMEDVESGKAGDPSQALFRMMSAPSPNQIIGQFVNSADPQVVQAMSGAVSSLLGGLSKPNMGVEVQVKASGEKIGSLCFQLQMTGYMFRNAEYVLALKDLMKLRGKKLTLKDYKDAFDRVDADASGYIEISEIQDLFKEAYGGREDDIPAFEIRAFLEFFDTNEDGKISWEEFEKGLASAATRQEKNTVSAKDDLADRLMASMENAGGDLADEEEKDEEHADDVSEHISGTIEIEMEGGKIVEVDANEYMKSLKEEARKLKLALRREKSGGRSSRSSENDPMVGILSNNSGGASDDFADIAGYIASRQGDVKSLTEGIKPEIVDTMRKLVDFVLDGGESGRGRDNQDLSSQEKAAIEMEIPGSALQQLALWQLVLGYRLREEEAKGDYVKLLK